MQNFDLNCKDFNYNVFLHVNFNFSFVKFFSKEIFHLDGFIRIILLQKMQTRLKYCIIQLYIKFQKSLKSEMSTERHRERFL